MILGLICAMASGIVRANFVLYSTSTNEIPGSSVDEHCLWPTGRHLQ